MKKEKVFDIPESDFSEEVYVRGKYEWLTVKLIKASEKLETTDLHINSIDMGVQVWDVATFYDFLEHTKRVNDTDLKYPVLQDNEGSIINGWHRIAKAWMKGETTVKARRFVEMPAHDRIIETEKE